MIVQCPVSTWMDDHLWASKPSRYVTATEVDSALYPPWDGKMSNNKKWQWWIEFTGCLYRRV